jgi:hypothetical protein
LLIWVNIQMTQVIEYTQNGLYHNHYRHDRRRRADPRCYHLKTT